MTKLKIVFKDKSTVTITLKASKEHLVEHYIREYNGKYAESVTIQKYPLKDNPLIDWLALNKK